MPGDVIARELVPLGGGLGGTLQQCAWPEALQSFLFALQWTILAMFSTNVTIIHHLISQAGWNRCNLSIYLSIFCQEDGCNMFAGLSPAFPVVLASAIGMHLEWGDSSHVVDPALSADVEPASLILHSGRCRHLGWTRHSRAPDDVSQPAALPL